MGILKLEHNSHNREKDQRQETVAKDGSRPDAINAFT